MLTLNLPAISESLLNNMIIYSRTPNSDIKQYVIAELINMQDISVNMMDIDYNMQLI